MRVALFGAGQIGTLHGRLLAADSGLDELLVADADPVRWDDAARSPGGRMVDTSSTNAHADLVRMADPEVAGAPALSSWSPKVFFNGATIMSTPTVDLIGIARAAGFDGVEVRTERLLDNPGEAKDAASAVRRGEVWSLNGIQLQLLPDGQLDRGRLIRELEPRLEICRDLQAGYLLVVPPRIPDIEVQRVVGAVQVGLDLVRQQASEIGVGVAFEFLGFGDCPINTPELAGTVVAGMPGIDVVLDSCHWHASGAGSLAGFPVDRLAMVHLNDVPPVPPRDIEDADRVLPGDGVIRLTELIAMLRGRGYRGPVSVETFNPAYWSRDPREIARLARASVDHLLASE